MIIIKLATITGNGGVGKGRQSEIDWRFQLQHQSTSASVGQLHDQASEQSD